ncbi:MAG: AMP-binding protein, partial [Nitrospinota bacterium]|nr:AMP-binding protein [Nitrospinota bacterium]
DPGRVGLADLPHIPFTEKGDIEKYNDDFLAVPKRKVADIVLSSGTTGKPTRIMYTESDMTRLAYNEKIALSRTGITDEDTVLLTCTMDRCFVAGQAYYSGLRQIGAAAIRNGLSGIASHLEILYSMPVSAIVGVPSFLQKLGESIAERGETGIFKSVKRLICIGEPVRDKELTLRALGAALENTWGAEVYSTYASSEIVTTFCECSERKGGHAHPALGYTEVIDSSGKTLPAGEVGEVVFTPFMVEGMPLLRFKTGDVSFFIDQPCGCGRSSIRLGPILGRKKQMIKMRGTTFYPQSIFAQLDEIEHVSEYYMVVSSEHELSDNVEVFVSVSDSTISPEDIATRLQAKLRVKPSVVIQGDEDIRSVVYSAKHRKPIRFFDHRRQ